MALSMNQSEVSSDRLTDTQVANMRGKPHDEARKKFATDVVKALHDEVFSFVSRCNLLSMNFIVVFSLQLGMNQACISTTSRVSQASISMYLNNNFRAVPSIATSDFHSRFPHQIKYVELIELMRFTQMK